MSDPAVGTYHETYHEAKTDHGSSKLVPAGTALDALIEDYANKRTLREQYDDVAKSAAKEEDEAQAKLFEAMEAQGLRAVRTLRGLFSLNDLPWAEVTDEVAARQWAENEHPEMITLNRQRLSPFIRPLLKDGEALPPGVGAKFQRKIGWRRS